METCVSVKQPQILVYHSKLACFSTVWSSTFDFSEVYEALVWCADWGFQCSCMEGRGFGPSMSVCVDISERITAY